MAHHYTVLIRKSLTEYWVDCPDIPGCIASGPSEEAAKRNFADALKFHLEGVKKHDKDYALPVPRSREAVLAAEEEAYHSVFSVDIDTPHPDPAAGK